MSRNIDVENKVGSQPTIPVTDEVMQTQRTSQQISGKPPALRPLVKQVCRSMYVGIPVCWSPLPFLITLFIIMPFASPSPLPDFSSLDFRSTPTLLPNSEFSVTSALPLQSSSSISSTGTTLTELTPKPSLSIERTIDPDSSTPSSDEESSTLSFPITITSPPADRNPVHSSDTISSISNTTRSLSSTFDVTPTSMILFSPYHLPVPDSAHAFPSSPSSDLAYSLDSSHENASPSFPTSAPNESPTAIFSKCCLSEEVLSFEMATKSLKCVRLDAAESANGSSTATATESELASDTQAVKVRELLARGFPQWLDPLVTVESAAGDKSTARDFLSAHLDARLRFGAHPRCADAQVVWTKHRDRFRLSADGTLHLRLSAWGGAGSVRLLPVDFCSDRVMRPGGGATRLALLACPCRRATCVRKCCGDAKLLHFSIGRHVSLECAARPSAVSPVDATSATDTAPNDTAKDVVGAVPWRPVFFDDDLHQLEEAPTHHLLQQGFPICPDGYAQILLNTEEDTNWRMWVHRNGSALMENFGHGRALPAAHWCGDASVGDPGSRLHNALLCHPTVAVEDPDARPTATNAAYGLLHVVGAIFFLLTLAVYAVLPELRAPPHAKALCCHCATLLVGSVMMAVSQLTYYQSAVYCVTSALITQFCFLASFFWLNVLCIDISWAFSGLRGLLGSLLDTSRRKYVYYSLYAWGCPVVITLVTAGLQEAWATNSLPKWVIAPQIGREYCWFYGVGAMLAFLYGPMLLLLVANAALFAFTAARLFCAHRDGAELNRGDSVRHDRSSRLSTEKRRMILYAKLFLLMGSTHIMEVVSWAVLPSVDGSGQHPLWFITDAINMLRGVFIFVIFCCKRTVARLLRKRLDAWGVLPPSVLSLACACAGTPSESERSPTHRSGLSTRQSSLIPMGPLPLGASEAKAPKP